MVYISFQICLASLCVSLMAAPLDSSSNTHTSHHEEKSSTPTTIGLNRPSPINPDVPSAPRPEERILLLTDDDFTQSNGHNRHRPETGNKKHRRQVLADTEAGVPISLKKPGEALDEDLKVPQAEASIVHQSGSSTTEKAVVKPVSSSPKPTDTENDGQTKVFIGHARHEDKRVRQDQTQRKTRHTDNDSTANRKPASATEVDASKPADPVTTQLLPVPIAASPISHSNPSVSHVKRESHKETSTHKPANEQINKHEDHSEHHVENHSPAFVHPVPVSEIIKNSDAVPVSHA